LTRHIPNNGAIILGGLAGVDYAPMLDGRTDHALPCQPFWWRMFRSAHAAGIEPAARQGLAEGAAASQRRDQASALRHQGEAVQTAYLTTIIHSTTNCYIASKSVTSIYW
jgi:hypothetical protein